MTPEGFPNLALGLKKGAPTRRILICDSSGYVRKIPFWETPWEAPICVGEKVESVYSYVNGLCLEVHGGFMGLKKYNWGFSPGPTSCLGGNFFEDIQRMSGRGSSPVFSRHYVPRAKPNPESLIIHKP